MSSEKNDEMKNVWKSFTKDEREDIAKMLESQFREWDNEEKKLQELQWSIPNIEKQISELTETVKIHKQKYYIFVDKLKLLGMCPECRGKGYQREWNDENHLNDKRTCKNCGGTGILLPSIKPEIFLKPSDFFTDDHTEEKRYNKFNASG